MLETIFISAAVISILAWIFDWNGSRKSKKEFEYYTKDWDCYKDPEYFTDDNSSN